MTRHFTNSLRFLCVTLAVLLAINCAGCLRGGGNEKIIPQEERYIDAKLGFSVIHPQTWERAMIPVSSPDFSKDSINWHIPASGSTGTMLIKVYPALRSATELPILLDQILEENADYSRGKIEDFNHPAGNALATTLSSGTNQKRLFVIDGIHSAYILSFEVVSEEFEKNSSLFERISESLRELP